MQMCTVPEVASALETVVADVLCHCGWLLLCATAVHCGGGGYCCVALVATWRALHQLPVKSFSHAVLTLDTHSNHRRSDEHHQHLFP